LKQPAANLVRRLWRYCGILRDDGLSYPDYVEQLTYLLFLKMAQEREVKPVPRQYSWASFEGKNAKDLHRHYGYVLQALGRRRGTLGLIFRNAKNKIKDPAKLRLLVEDLIGQTEWSNLSRDVKGEAYEGLLEKNAQDTKSGAGQYFTPRVVIDAVVACIQPQLREVICDPACGTGGFLLSATQYLRDKNLKLTPAQERKLSAKTLRGVELVEEVARLATMNLLLHGIGGDVAENDLPIICADSLKTPPAFRADVILTNPPFGTRGSVTFTQRQSNGNNNDLVLVRPDFWVTTANKQLNFVQHVVAMLKRGGRAAMVLPDNVLFESGAAATIRKRLLETCDVHTLLRLPTGLFYAQGVKANVLFFDKVARKGLARERSLWVYNLRGTRVSPKQNPLRNEDIAHFVKCYSPGARHKRRAQPEKSPHYRWRRFEIGEILKHEHCRLDLSWVVSAPLRTSEVRADLTAIAHLIESDLRNALSHLSEMQGIAK
jgi:type I restriction enzyme M protein